MKLIPLFHSPIDKTKDGRKWDSTFFLSEKGKVLPVFMSRDKYIELELADSDFLTKEDVKDIFSKFKPVEVYFDEVSNIDKIER